MMLMFKDALINDWKESFRTISQIPVDLIIILGYLANKTATFSNNLSTYEYENCFLMFYITENLISLHFGAIVRPEQAV